MKHLGRGGIVLASLIALFGAFATSASAVVFSNPGSIAINDAADDGSGGSVPANATPYPSNIVVSGVPGAVTDVNVTLNVFTHTFPDDVGVLLRAPNGAALLLMDGLSEVPVNAVDTTLNDSAISTMPDVGAWTSGSYKPTSYYGGDAFPTPGPGTAYNNPGFGGGPAPTLASTFNGGTANGTWSLFVRDFDTGDSGSIAGWSLELNNPPPPPLPIVKNTPPPPLDQQPQGLPTCGGKTVKMIGTSGPDTIVGTSGPDVISGLGGNDTIKGLAGNDTLCGGGGSDKLKGGSGADKLKGGGGSDTCKGGGSSDAASGCELKKSIP